MKKAEGLKGMKVIGAVGQIGSGKDTIIRYISDRLKISIVSIGDIARGIAANDGLPATRENLQKITERFYEKFGKAYFVEETIKRIIQSGHEKMLITGVRAPIDIATLKKFFNDGFILIHVETSQRKRFERLVKRGEPRDPKTWDEFLKQDHNEEKIFHLSESCKFADYQINNDGTMEELFQKIDEITKKTSTDNQSKY